MDSVNRRFVWACCSCVYLMLQDLVPLLRLSGATIFVMLFIATLVQELRGK